MIIGGGEQQPRHHRLLLLPLHYWRRRPHPKKEEAMLQTIPSTGRMRLTWSQYGREHSKNSPLLLRLKLVVVLPLLLRRLCLRRMLIFIISNRVLDWDER